MTNMSNKHSLNNVILQLCFKDNGRLKMQSAICEKTNRDKVAIVEIVGQHPTSWVYRELYCSAFNTNTREHYVGRPKIIADVVKNIVANGDNIISNFLGNGSAFIYLPSLRFDASLSNRGWNNARETRKITVIPMNKIRSDPAEIWARTFRRIRIYFKTELSVHWSI